MNNQQQVIALIKSLSGQANILTIPRVYIDLLDGDITTALLLNQIVYWSDKSSRTDGWFYKTYKEWKAETGLTQFQVSRSAKILSKLGIVNVKRKRANAAPTLHYKLDFRLLTNLIIEKLDNRESEQTDCEETQQSENEETQQSLTEITTETTTEITSPKKPNNQALMVGALTRATGMDFKLERAKGRLTKAASELVAAGYTSEQVDRCYSPDCWWYQKDWRGQKGQKPTLEQIMDTLNQAKQESAPPPPRKTEKVQIILPGGEISEAKR
jgi:hypothetical protein